MVVETVRGRDSKLYPAELPRSRDELNRLRWWAHQLHCERGLTIKAAQAAMLAAGTRRSVGAICQDLRRFECPACAGAGDGS